MQTDLISVIVPVYKVEEYLCECLDSIINQTYKNLEIILVDDGSPDNCGKICDDYALKDSRIKVIHQQNGGLSAARNAGLDIATGDYIGFVDSDDYIDLNMYEELCNSIKTNDADIAVCGIKQFGIIKRTIRYNDSCLTNLDYLKSILQDNAKSSFNTKLFKRNLFFEIRFPVGQIFEDFRTLPFVVDKAKKISFTSKVFYYYRTRENSITSDNTGDNAKEYLDASQERMERYRDSEYYVYAVAARFQCLRLVVSDMSAGKHDAYIYKNLFKESKQLYKTCKGQITGIQRVVSGIYIISPKLYYYMKKAALKYGILS